MPCRGAGMHLRTDRGMDSSHMGPSAHLPHRATGPLRTRQEGMRGTVLRPQPLTPPSLLRTALCANYFCVPRHDLAKLHKHTRWKKARIQLSNNLLIYSLIFLWYKTQNKRVPGSGFQSSIFFQLPPKKNSNSSWITSSKQPETRRMGAMFSIIILWSRIWKRDFIYFEVQSQNLSQTQTQWNIIIRFVRGHRLDTGSEFIFLRMKHKGVVPLCSYTASYTEARFFLIRPNKISHLSGPIVHEGQLNSPPPCQFTFPYWLSGV